MQMHTMGGAQASRPRHRSHSILQTGAGDQALMRLQARSTSMGADVIKRSRALERGVSPASRLLHYPTTLDF